MLHSLGFVSKPWIVFFLNKGMSAGKARIQWQGKCSDCEGITGRRGLCPASGNKRGGLALHKEFPCQVFLKKKTIINTDSGDKSWWVLHE